MNAWLILGLAFACSAALVGFILYALSAGSWRVGQRLESIKREGAGGDQGRGRQERRDRFPLVASALERTGRYSALERQLARAGLNWLPGEFAVAWAAATAALALGGWLLFGLLGTAAAIVVAWLASFLGLKALEAKRLRQFEHQLPDALMLIASSLRSGYGIQRAMQAVRDEMAPPISTEFAKVLDEANLGMPIPDALTRLVQRVPLRDLDIAVTAILIQLDVGGNLAEIMEIVAATVRERQRIRAEVDTLTAEGRLSGVILFALPLVMAGVLMVLNRPYMSALFQTTLGHLLILSAAVLQILGGLVINCMLRLDF